MSQEKPKPKEGHRLVVVPWVIRNGKKIFPKRSKFFAFYVKDEKKAA